MENFAELPQIKIAASNGDAKSSTFNSKNYLNVRLANGEKKKTLTIRLLPMDLSTGNLFLKVHVHNVNVPKEVASSGFKSYICLHRNKGLIDEEKYGDKCPFCELNSSAFNESKNATDPVEKKKWTSISLDNKAKEAVIVRCIERGAESDGVKFWKFNLRNDETDPYHAIINLYNNRMESGEDIFDYEKGRDLTVTFTAEGTSAPQIIDGKQCPLSTDYNQMKAWVFDNKSWKDVFGVKPYEYLRLVSEMRVPWYDRNKGMWVDKEEYNRTYGVSRNNEEAETTEVHAEAVTPQEIIAPTPAPAPVSATPVNEPASVDSKLDFDDDLPF